MKKIAKGWSFVAITLALCASVILGCKCSTSKPTPDPLAGFHVDALHTVDSNKAIDDDYKKYIKGLSLKKEDFIGSVDFLEDGVGQHAVDIKIGINGTWWEHVLIYDKENKRIKAIKYRNGGYRS